MDSDGAGSDGLYAAVDGSGWVPQPNPDLGPSLHIFHMCGEIGDIVYGFKII